MSSVIQLKVFLTRHDNSEDPGIYRRLLIPDNINFYDLHCMIQISLGWCGVGLHQFGNLYDRDIICNDYDMFTGVHGRIFDSRRYRIKGYLKRNALLYYDYLNDVDYHWEAVLFVEDILDKIPDKTYPVCLDGSRNSPPEECDGWDEYHNIILAMRLREGYVYRRYLELNFSEYDPELFTIGDVNDQLAHWHSFRAHWLNLK